MDPISVVPFPLSTDDPLERDLVEIDAAIGLVAHGRARRVQLVALARPEAIGPTALARAQAAGLRFTLDRGAAGVAVTIGPRETRPA